MKTKQAVRHASEFTCCEKKCKEKAVAFWPAVDPDIPAHPYCRECLDKAQIKLLLQLYKK